MEEVDREISEMKLSLNARARTVAESYLTAVSLLCLRRRGNLISSVVQPMSGNPYRRPFTLFTLSNIFRVDAMYI